MNSSDWIIETRGLSKSYGPVQALKALDLKVARYSIFGFLGPNGAGKTTTLKLLLGLTRPTAGGGTICGLDIVRNNLEARRHIGYLAQNPRFYEQLTAREMLRFRAGFFYRGPRSQIEARLAETLELVGLADKADRPIKGFSGGEVQRLGIGLAQINSPELLILDEPAANLDPEGRRDMLEVMARLRQRATILYCTHILDDVQQVSDTVAILNRGELVAQSPLTELLHSREGTTYTIVLTGETQALQTRLAALPWVAKFQVLPSTAHTTWQVTVTDEAAARADLLRQVLADPQVNVLEFSRQKRELEEVFLSLVERGANEPH